MENARRHVTGPSDQVASQDFAIPDELGEQVSCCLMPILCFQFGNWLQSKLGGMDPQAKVANLLMTCFLLKRAHLSHHRSLWGDELHRTLFMRWWLSNNSPDDKNEWFEKFARWWGCNHITQTQHWLSLSSWFTTGSEQVGICQVQLNMHHQLSASFFDVCQSPGMWSILHQFLPWNQLVIWIQWNASVGIKTFKLAMVMPILGPDHKFTWYDIFLWLRQSILPVLPRCRIDHIHWFGGGRWGWDLRLSPYSEHCSFFDSA